MPLRAGLDFTLMCNCKFFNVFVDDIDRALKITGYDYLLRGYNIVNGVKL